MAFDIVALLAGLLLLFLGGEWLVRGAVSLANRLGLPPLLIGLTVIGFGTSMPELLVSLRAATSGSPDIAVGNVVGSNIANVLLIAGMAATISPIAAKIRGLRRDLAMMIIACFGMLALGGLGGISAWAGAAMVLVLALYLAAVTVVDRRNHQPHGPETLLRLSGTMEAAMLTGGFAALFFGADLLVDSAVNIARAAGLSEAAIGLSIVAVGTSLPELATSVAAAKRGHGEVALGNVVGSNMFNILAILGITSLIAPIDISPSIARIDIPVMIGVALLLAAIIVVRHRIGRIAGTVMLAGYAVYIFTLF